MIMSQELKLDPTDDVGQIRCRLLDAAEILFAEKGFAATSVRDITTMAKCNVASVNYYFGSKLKLYTQMFAQQLDYLRDYRMNGIRKAIRDHGDDLTIDELVRAFAHAFLEPLFDVSHGRRTLELFMREMLTPKLPEGMMYFQMMRPVSEMFVETLTKISPELSHDKALHCLHSLVAQLLLVVQSQKMFASLDKENHPMSDLCAVVDHIVQFTNAGIHGYLEEEKE